MSDDTVLARLLNLDIDVFRALGSQFVRRGRRRVVRVLRARGADQPLELVVAHRLQHRQPLPHAETGERQAPQDLDPRAAARVHPEAPAPEVRGVDAPGDPEPIPDPPAPPGDDAPPPPPADVSPVAGMLCCKQNGDGQLNLSC